MHLSDRVQLDQIHARRHPDPKRAWVELHKEVLTGRGFIYQTKDVVPRMVHWPTWMVVMQLGNSSHHLGGTLTLVRQAGYAPSKATGPTSSCSSDGSGCRRMPSESHIRQ